MISMIIDTDIGPDCDDVGAMGVALNFIREKKIDLLAVTCCNSLKYAPLLVKTIFDTFGIQDLPIGYLKSKKLFEDHLVYNKSIVEQFCKNTNMEFEDATWVLRKALYESKEKVTLVTIGTFTNISNLIDSKATEEIPLTGLELIEQKVEKLISMAGTFSLDFDEFNIQQDVQAAKNVMLEFPKKIIFQGFEVGNQVFTGEPLITENLEGPIKKSYEYYLKHVGTKARESWDLTTVYYAANLDSPYFRLNENGTILLDEIGKTSFDPIMDSNHGYVQLSDGKAKELEDELNAILLKIHHQ